MFLIPLRAPRPSENCTDKQSASSTRPDHVDTHSTPYLSCVLCYWADSGLPLSPGQNSSTCPLFFYVISQTCKHTIASPTETKDVNGALLPLIQPAVALLPLQQNSFKQLSTLACPDNLPIVKTWESALCLLY